MELYKSRGYKRLQNKVLLNLRNYLGKNTELVSFVLKISVNFIEFCLVIACIRDS